MNTEDKFFDLTTAEGREKSFAAGLYPYQRYMMMEITIAEEIMETEKQQPKHNWSKEGF